MLRKLKFILKRHVLLCLYKSFILSNLEYACELWDGCLVSDSIRIITGLPSYGTVSALRALRHFLRDAKEEKLV